MDEEQMESIPIDLIPVLIPVPINKDAVSARFVPFDVMNTDETESIPIDLIPVLIPVPIDEDAVSARFVPIGVMNTDKTESIPIDEDAVSACNDQERNSPILKFFK
jgi:hypothetical protein